MYSISRRRTYRFALYDIRSIDVFIRPRIRDLLVVQVVRAKSILAEAEHAFFHDKAADFMNHKARNDSSQVHASLSLAAVHVRPTWLDLFVLGFFLFCCFVSRSLSLMNAVLQERERER